MLDRRRLLRRGLLTVLIPLLLVGCHSWRPTATAPGAVVAGERPRTVRMTLSDGRVLTMAQPRIEGDSIVGRTLAGTARVAAEDVRAMEVEQWSPTRTFALVVGHASAVLSVIAIIIAVQPHYRGL